MAKAKINVTVDPILLAWLDKKVDEGVFRNRSHAFDAALKLLKKTDEKDSSKGGF